MSNLARNLIVAAVAVMLLALIAAAAWGGEWNWSPHAEHHRAAVRVQSGRNAGSGVYVRYEGLIGVLTAAHVIAGGSATVTFFDGQSRAGSTTHDKYGNDVGFVSVEHPGIEPLAIAESAPAKGERVEFVTYGGPEQRLRSYWSTAQSERQLVGGADFLYSTATIPGDSGGAILNGRHEVVGIQSAGRSNDINQDGNWPVYRGSVSATCGAIRAFVQRVREKMLGGWRASPPDCPDGHCPRRGGGGAIWERGGKIEFYPPGRLAPERQEPPPVLPGPGPADDKPKPPAALERLEAIDKALADAKKAQTALDDRLGQVADSVSEGRLKGLLAEAVEGLPGSRPEPEPEPQGPIATNPPVGKKGGVPWDLLAVGAAGALGFGVPTWAVLALRGLLAARRLRKSREGLLRPPALSSRDTETTVVVDAPPAAERRRIDTQFVNVESDHYQRAHELARQEVARRYPGAQEVLAAELDLTRQFAAGISPT